MRVRVRYSKLGKIRFLSHRDLARVLERAVRRAELPVAYSQGFSPRARLHFGLALSTGYESVAEFVDVDLDDDAGGLPDPDKVADLLRPCLPVGIVSTASVELAADIPELQDAVTSSTWEVTTAAEDLDTATAAASELLAADAIPVDLVRKGKQVREDLRPLLLSLDVTGSSDATLLTFELGTKPRSVRPAELLAAMELPEHPIRVVRTHQWIQSDGERREPIELAAPSPHASVRAS